MLRGHIVALNGVPAEKIKAPPDARWVLNGDRGLTFTDRARPTTPTIVRAHGGRRIIAASRSFLSRASLGRHSA